MTYIMRIVARGPIEFKAETYLKSFDHEAYDGVGNADFTSDPLQAMPFADYRAAVEFWKRIPKCKPVRPDGKPNRPLSATTIEIMEL